MSASSPLLGVADVGRSDLWIPGTTVVKSTVPGCLVVVPGIATGSTVAASLGSLGAAASVSLAWLCAEVAGFNGDELIPLLSG
jgi:hypothetical protein